MQATKLTLSDQDVLEEKFFNLSLNISEYSFANLYLFRHVHQYELITERGLFIKGISRDGSSFLMLTNHPSELSNDRLFNLASQFNFLFPIPQAWLPFFDESSFTSVFLEPESDYLFTKEKMQTYAGRHLDSKRNFINQFLSRYQSQSFSLTPDRAQDAQQVLNQWQQEQSLSLHQTDFLACQEALSLMEKLHLTGYITYIDAKPIAFILGQKLNPDTYVIHFIKGTKDFKGIYPYLYQLLAKSLDDEVHFLNLEQDLGIPNLRKNKQSYQPDQMAHKFRISKKLIR